MSRDDFPKVEFKTRPELRRWLETNHADAGTFWLVTWKKHTAHCLPYGDIVEELLCFGWVDGGTRRVDDDRTMLLVAPRKAGSTWSGPNKKRVAVLINNRLMTPAGQARIDSAKADGSWTFLDDVEKLIVPADLADALARNKRAERHFTAFNNAAKKIILLWIKTAKRDATRQKRIRETVRLAALNVKAAHPESQGK